MSLRVSALEAKDMAAWDAFVLATPTGTFFQRAGWKTVIERSFRQTCHFMKAERDGQIVGVLPLVLVKSRLFGTRLVSTGWCVGGAPVAVDDEAMDALDAAAASLLQSTDATYIEYRDPLKSRVAQGWVAKEGLYATFDRPMAAGEDECLKQIPRKQRAVVRKALDSELTFAIERNSRPFYDLYSLSMRNLGTPVFSRRYIDSLLDVFAADSDILTVYDAGKPVSSVLNFYFRDRVMPYYTGADPSARRSGAADLMYYRVMRHAVDKGYSVFDFGRSKLETGPYAFKKNWGFEPRPVVHEFLLKAGTAMPDVNPNNPSYKWKIDVWKKLPLPLANLFGPWLGRQVG